MDTAMPPMARCGRSTRYIRSTLGESLDPLQLLDVRLVPQAIRLFGANQRVDIRDRHGDSLDVERLKLRRSIRIADAAGQRQNVDARIIAHDREWLGDH